MIELRPEAVYGKTLNEIWPSAGEGLARFIEAIDTVSTTGESQVLEMQVPVESAVLRMHHISIVAEWDRNGAVQGVLAIGRDITERRSMEEQLAQREQEFRALAKNSPDAIVRFDSGLRRLYINPAAQAITGPAYNYGVGCTPDHGSPVIDVVRFKALLQEVFDRGEQREAEFKVRKVDGIGTVNARFVPEVGESGQVQTVLAVSRDITASVNQRERIQRLAYSDSLTGLANRALLYDRVRDELSVGPNTRGGVGLMLLDIDHFKDVNDTLGHSRGDELLKEVASRLSACIRETDTLARLGGDEFVILVANIRDDAELQEIAERIQRAMAPVFRLSGSELFVSCSIGITTVVSGEWDIDELMGSADEALYEAKRNGRNKAQFYRPELSQQTMEKVALGQALRQALDRREFSLVFQPKCRLGDGHLVGVEALLRWKHPTLGPLSPDRFISVAEESGQIVEIGRWVLERACAAIVRQNKYRAQPITMAVNISPRQITTGALTEHIAPALEASGCPPAWLEIEITEGMMLQDSESVQETLSAISRMGVSIAVDDFGTGHSALAYIDRFPINVVKIDRSFTMSIDRDPRKAAVVRAFVSLADALDLDVVAEGVETAEQVRLLRKFGCEIGQGYFYSKPMTALALARRYGLCKRQP
ncbi:putative bifunctional diguanylate cyclase/phosphodiesterase [Bradyrhizobium sp. UFLA05-112]